MHKDKELKRNIEHVVEAFQSSNYLSPSKLITMTKRKMYLEGHAPQSAVLRAKAITAIRKAEQTGLIRKIEGGQIFCNIYELVREE